MWFGGPTYLPFQVPIQYEHIVVVPELHCTDKMIFSPSYIYNYAFLAATKQL